MRKIQLIIVCIIISTLGFSQSIDKKYVGDWVLIEAYVDPGDGSGTFRKADSKKNIVISADGKIESNVNLCYWSLEQSEPTKGKLTESNKELIFEGCKSTLKVIYRVEGEYLVVYYPCKEGCAEKYKRKD
jgi:hypothetical protein